MWFLATDGYPTNLPDRVLWWANFATQFEIVAESLDLAAKIPQVNDDNTVMQFSGDADTAADAYKAAVLQYIKIITENAPGTPTPQFPPNPKPNLPKIVTTGIFTRLDKLVQQIRNADNYTDEIGAQLGILPKAKDTTKPEDKKPTLKGQTFPAQELHVGFVRGDSDGVNLRITVDGGEPIDIGNFGKSPAVIHVPGDPTKPHEVEIVGRYVQNNKPVGQNSDEIKLVSQP